MVRVERSEKKINQHMKCDIHLLYHVKESVIGKCIWKKSRDAQIWFVLNALLL